MAQLTVMINGYSYTIGCEDGQEDHLLAMAGLIEARISDIQGDGGHGGESKMLAMAALLMADELHDHKVELASLRKQMRDAGVPHPVLAPEPVYEEPVVEEIVVEEVAFELGEDDLAPEKILNPRLAVLLEGLALRAEEIADLMEQA